MRQWLMGVAVGALAAGLALQAQAQLPGAGGGRTDTGLAAPAPVPGTLDFQYAALTSTTARAPAEVSAAAPSVGLARRAVDAAGAFDAYTRQASAIGVLKDGPGVIGAVKAAAAYEASQLQEGAIAYGALAALQDPMFVDAVRAAAPDAASREALAAELVARPAVVLRLPGAHGAAARVTRLVGARGAALADAGAAVNKASYSVQKEAWSKAPLAHAQDDLKAVKARSGERASLSVEETRALMSGLPRLRKEVVEAADEPGFRPTPATAQALALAALAVLGRAGEDHVADVSQLLSTDQGADCLKLAKLNLYQCLAVAGPHYEDMFCLGRHALADTGQCLMSTAGWTGPAPAAAAPVTLASMRTEGPAPVAAVSPIPAAVEVPVALAALDGPERSRAYADPPADAPPPPPPPSGADEGRFAVARADAPQFRSLGGPGRLDEAEDGDVPPAREQGGRAAPSRPAPDMDDEDDAPYARPSYAPPSYAYARYDAPRSYRPAPGYGWRRPQYEEAAPSYQPAYGPSYGYGQPAYPGGGWSRGPYDDGR